MTSCIGISLLSRFAVRRGGRRGRFFFLSVLFFASGGSSHGRTSSDLCLGLSVLFALSTSAGTDTGSSRDVTLHSTGDRRGEGRRGLRAQLLLIIYETRLPSCQTLRAWCFPKEQYIDVFRFICVAAVHICETNERLLHIRCGHTE